MAAVTERVRPNDQTAEAALIGCCLNSARALDDAIGTVTGDDFYKPHHGHVWAAMTALHLAGQPVDTVTVLDQMRQTGTLLPDSPALLADLLADAPATSGLRRHVEIVVNLSRARRLQAVALEIAERCCDPTGGPEAVIDWAQEQVYQVAQERRRTAETVTLATAVDQWMTMLEETAAGTRSPGLPTGLADLDRHLGGLRGGQLITAAGRPAMGKSLLGSQVAVHVAAAGIPVLLVSVEMSIPELVGRMVGAESQVGLTHLRSGRIPDKSWPHISTATSKLSGLPLYLLDDSGATITTVRTQGRRLKGRSGLGLIVVDYLQLMSSTTRRDNRAVEVGELSGGLKRIARDLDVPVIALAQLNRGVEYRQDKRPTLADLRESGAIENDSDVVLGLYRDEYYNPGSPDTGTAEILVLKQRNGPAGVTAKVGYRPDIGVFTNLAGEERY